MKFLSGGERNRVLLARHFAKPANLIVLDEPTNDLDAETLELLEERLMEYTGTVIVVSHDPRVSRQRGHEPARLRARGAAARAADACGSRVCGRLFRLAPAAAAAGAGEGGGYRPQFRRSLPATPAGVVPQEAVV